MQFIIAQKGRDFQKLPYGSETLGITSEGLEKKIQVDFADMHTKFVCLYWWWGRRGGHCQAFADREQ